MAQTKKQIEAALASAGSRPRHRFGQNFMVEPSLVRVIADAGEIEPGDTVIEVGPGTGTLTEELLQRVDPSAGGKVVAVEIDRDLAAMLRQRFGERVTLIEGDALAGKHALNPELEAAVRSASSCKLVANLPYNIASPLVVELLLAGVELLAFTVQREVADRLAAGPDRPADYGPLTVVVQSLARVEVLRTISPAAFWPRPAIESALVRLRCHAVPADPGLVMGRAFSRFVLVGFGQRRKAIRNPLARVISPDRLGEALSAAGLSGSERAEQVSLEQWQTLFRFAKDPA